ncbi:hypothetical protein DAPPUDRAFT_111651 [Daphnia pulex]|uniref:Potassium channel domain-containing protein n=1 Tax=Daphnia pulex TaxID=6669 RepID=E9H9W4_DAPPU|nr:hypothetical protein DAPPUDRAFT_111651 [Daphnia pulex]|eukprot:EFX71540.1 hypothetical protein DAPPUDRAFT_111651 [Daphnia pulex]
MTEPFDGIMQISRSGAMENSGGSTLKRQLPSKQMRRSSGGERTTDCSRGWSAKLSLLLFFLAYVSLGAYVFMLIEASAASSASHPFHQHTPPTEEIRTALSGTGLSTTSEPTAITTDGAAGEDVTQMKELMTRQVLDKLWDITENLNILYKENWTRLAAGEIYRFHETMYLWMKKDCSNDRRKSQEMTAVGQATTAATPRAAGTAAGHNRQTTAVKWNYPTAFLYALSVITTLGSCPVIPESNEGKILTILFAAFGIPLLLFYLTVVGSALSSCLMCCPLLNKRKIGGGGSGRRRREHVASGHMSAVPAVPPAAGQRIVIPPPPPPAAAAAAADEIVGGRQRRRIDRGQHVVDVEQQRRLPPTRRQDPILLAARLLPPPGPLVCGLRHFALQFPHVSAGHRRPFAQLHAPDDNGHPRRPLGRLERTIILAAGRRFHLHFPRPDVVLHLFQFDLRVAPGSVDVVGQSQSVRSISRERQHASSLKIRQLPLLNKFIKSTCIKNDFRKNGFFLS